MCHLWFNLVQEQNCSSFLSHQINQNCENIINKTGNNSLNNIFPIIIYKHIAIDYNKMEKTMSTNNLYLDRIDKNLDIILDLLL